MLPNSLLLLCLSALTARALDTTNFVTFSSPLSTLSSVPTVDFSGSQYSYDTATGQSTVSSSESLSGSRNASTATASSTATSTSSNSQVTRTTASHSQIALVGSTTSSNSTGSSTSSAAFPSNTLPCNNYPEFCNRKYSNITEVCSHNSAFVVPNNAASNQALPILDQLDDGVRMLQGETHIVNNTVYNCHTSCDLLNAGPWQSELETVVGWLEKNPYEVLTILIVNSDYANNTYSTNYTSAVENSGIMPYLYTPQYVPQHRDQWPTLGEMILSGKRVVMFMDYNANQTAVPYILDEFTHIWETPYSPTNQNFPCTQQRPPGLSRQHAEENYMYLANHNLDTAVDIGAITGGSSMAPLLIPNYAELNITNGEYDQFGELEATRLNCTENWNRPPNFLLVDYYNIGVPHPGSVFEVAARANGVTYNRPCCGVTQSAAPAMKSSFAALTGALVFAVMLAW